MNKSTTTTDCNEIRRWAEERKGKPVAVKGTSRGEGDPGIIRIDFPGYSGGAKLQPISWDQWCQKFADSNLAMIIQYETKEGAKSNFNRFMSRDKLEEQPKRRGQAARTRRGAAGARSSGARGVTSARGRRAGTPRARAAARNESQEPAGKRTSQDGGRTTGRPSQATSRRAGGAKAATGRRTRELGGSPESTSRSTRRAGGRARPVERARNAKGARASRSR